MNLKKVPRYITNFCMGFVSIMAIIHPDDERFFRAAVILILFNIFMLIDKQRTIEAHVQITERDHNNFKE